MTKSRVYLNLFFFFFKQVSCNCCNQYTCTAKWCQQNSNACSYANKFKRNINTLIGFFNLLTGTLLANNIQRILMKNLSHQPIWSTCHQNSQDKSTPSGFVLFTQMYLFLKNSVINREWLKDYCICRATCTCTCKYMTSHK